MNAGRRVIGEHITQGRVQFLKARQSNPIMKSNRSTEGRLAGDSGFRPQRRLLATNKAARLMPCSSLLVARRGARRTDRDCVLAKEAYLDVCLYFHRVAKNFIWAIAPLPDGLDARFC